MRGSMFTGGKTNNYDREKHDYYATPPYKAHEFLRMFDISKYNKILEPSCGEGHLSEVLKKYAPNSTIISRDLIDRGYGEVKDFLKDKDDNKYDLIITNPPFKKALSFIKRGLELSDTVVILAKIQLLEGEKKK